VHYQGNGGLYPIYECSWRKREGFPSCIFVRCDLLDTAVCRRVLEVFQPDQLQMALAAVEELEKREEASSRQWLMRIERAEYEAQLAEKRYMESDPSNRLVAATLEQRWNTALVVLEEVKQQFAQFREKEHHTVSPEQKQKILALARDFPRLWNSASTKAKDRKRMLRLLIKDITVEKTVAPKQAVLHIRWQGCLCEDIAVDFPLKAADRLRYPEKIVQKVRDLAAKFTDDQIVAFFNEEGCLSATGKPFTVDMIRWIRFKHGIQIAQQKGTHEMTVQEVADHFDVSSQVVYYWIERGVVIARRRKVGCPYLITIDPLKEEELVQWTQSSTRINKQRQERQRIPNPC
jgi:hypothetical protein